MVGRDETTYDLRVVSEVFESNGGRYLNVVFEDQWYRWQEAGEDAPPGAHPAGHLCGDPPCVDRVRDPHPGT